MKNDHRWYSGNTMGKETQNQASLSLVPSRSTLLYPNGLGSQNVVGLALKVLKGNWSFV